MDGAGHVERRRHGRGHRGDCVFVGEIVDFDGRHCLGFRQYLERHFGQNTKGAMAARHELDEVVAGDVFHNPPAVLDDRPLPVDETDA